MQDGLSAAPSEGMEGMAHGERSQNERVQCERVWEHLTCQAGKALLLGRLCFRTSFVRRIMSQSECSSSYVLLSYRMYLIFKCVRSQYRCR